MNNSSTNSSSENISRTDWERVDALTDEEIDTSDAPPLTEEFFAKAAWLSPGERLPHRAVPGRAGQESVRVELDLDPQTLAWFQSLGQDYERRMRAALRLYAEAHQAVV